MLLAIFGVILVGWIGCWIFAAASPVIGDFVPAVDRWNKKMNAELEQEIRASRAARRRRR